MTPGGGAHLDPHAAPPHRARLRTPPPPAPAGVATGGRTHTSAQGRCTDHARGRHATMKRSSMGAAPPMT